MLGNGGATAFWDIATFGLIKERSQHLNFGEFSSKFASRGQGCTVPRRPDGHQIRPRRRARRPIAEAGIDAYALTAQRDLDRRHDADQPRRQAPTTDSLVLVDATSAAAGWPSTSAQSDVYYFAPQKCFASDGGLWLALFSARQRWPASQRSRRPAAGSRRSSTCRPRSTTAGSTRRTTPRLVTLWLLADQTRLDELAGRPELDHVAHCRFLRSGSTPGPRRTITRRRSSPTPACART